MEKKLIELEGYISLSTKEEIVSQWDHYKWGKKLEPVFGKNILIKEETIECLKNSREKTSIWKITISNQTETFPVVLKIFKPPLKENHIVEINMYRKASSIFQEFMPKLYWIEESVNKGEIWMLSEFLPLIRGQIKLTPEHLYQIIPTVAKFHALTFEKRILDYKETLDSWVPLYNSVMMAKERVLHIEKTREILDLSVNNDILREKIEPKYDILRKIYSKGPIFFPELLEAGQCLIHGDLHLQNICGKFDLSNENSATIQFIDWESAKYAPCWYDLVVLVELLIDFRKDWHKKAEDIRSNCAVLYSHEMRKYGITFSEEPVKLLKMAYLQRALEKRVLNHLRRVMRGEQSKLLNRYLDKIELWGKELDLY